MKHFVWVWLVIGALPLVIYPFVLLANIMGIAGYVPDNMTFFQQMQRIIAYTFYLGTTLYPLVYFYSLVATLRLFREENHNKAVLLSITPLLYLLLCIGIFCITLLF